jgi:phosphatidylserine decarboxylase
VIYFLVITINLFLGFSVFAILYKKIQLPKSCFFKEAITVVFVSSIIDAVIVNNNSITKVFLLQIIFVLFVSTIGVILLRFYRDPKREFYGDENIVISPADGKIIYIRKIEKGIAPISTKGKSNIPLSEIAKTNILNTDCWLIGINMSILDVHVNRAPVGGEVIFIEHYPGEFLSLKSLEADIHNERNIIIIKRKIHLIGIIQIASRTVRRIKTYVKKEQSISRGDKIGKIIFGSQVDLILPVSARILIKEGLQVYGGLTPIATIDD